jgi:hypothetical protein
MASFECEEPIDGSSPCLQPASANQIEHDSQQDRCKKTCNNRPSQDDSPFSTEVSTTHPGQQVKPLLLFIVRKQTHKPAVTR